MRFPLLAAVMCALVLEGCGSGAGRAAVQRDRPASPGERVTRCGDARPAREWKDGCPGGRTHRGVAGGGAGPRVGDGRECGRRARPPALASLPLVLEAGKSYTVLVAGPVRALTAMVSVDTGSAGSPPRRPPVDSGNPPPPPPQPPVDSGNPPPPRPWISSGSGSCTRRRTRRRSIPICCRPAPRWTPSPRCSRSRTAAWRSPPTWYAAGPLDGRVHRGRDHADCADVRRH